MKVTIKPIVKYELVVEEGLKTPASLGVFTLVDEWQGMSRFTKGGEVVITDSPKNFEGLGDLSKKLFPLPSEQEKIERDILKLSPEVIGRINTAVEAEMPEDAATGTVPS